MAMRLTPARRDFLRLCTLNDLVIYDSGKRFLRYEIPGQINKKISRKNFEALAYSGHLYLAHVDIHDDGSYRETWRATDKARALFNG